ncbi:energy-coupling factor transporter transmembrane component T family protein [Sporosarcina sp. ANT_H38]|uniref:energy-coupling factor transporter transmembrane component T family protein n=1 Tax=Sporosarcina sp. ANT_H38 TaxID=2597358 RepID=UPI0021030563|nr:energy-coupling factor transporter transmembrane component T [Sporosarcina sp. ANT_H38]
MTLYVDKKSVIHDIDPLSKLLFVFISIAITYILPTHLFVISVLAFTFIVLLVGKVFTYIFPVIGVSMLLIISIVIVQGFFHPDRATLLFEIGPLPVYKEGFAFAFLLTLRIINMVCAFGVLILTTKPDHLVDSLIYKGMSPKIGYVFLSVLQIIPQMMAMTSKITDAQRSRGMEKEGKLKTRIKSFIPLLGPVVLNSLNDTRERSIALEIRGFNAKGTKSFLNESFHYKYGLILKLILVILLFAAIVWRIVL